MICFSGFTSLCETYGNLGTTDASCGTEKLTATLNTYIGKIVEGNLQIVFNRIIKDDDNKVIY